MLPDLILTDQDFGEFYLRRRVIPDLLYDAARIFHLVLVGYTASDPPVRYLLDAISADDARFRDLKPRFVFVPIKGDVSDGGDACRLERSRPNSDSVRSCGKPRATGHHA